MNTCIYCEGEGKISEKQPDDATKLRLCAICRGKGLTKFPYTIKLACFIAARVYKLWDKLPRFERGYHDILPPEPQ